MAGVENPHYISTPLMLLEYLGEILTPLHTRRSFEHCYKKNQNSISQIVSEAGISFDPSKKILNGEETKESKKNYFLQENHDLKHQEQRRCHSPSN